MFTIIIIGQSVRFVIGGVHDRVWTTRRCPLFHWARNFPLIAK